MGMVCHVENVFVTPPQVRLATWHYYRGHSDSSLLCSRGGGHASWRFCFLLNFVNKLKCIDSATRDIHPQKLKRSYLKTLSHKTRSPYVPVSERFQDN